MECKMQADIFGFGKHYVPIYFIISRRQLGCNPIL